MQHKAHVKLPNTLQALIVSTIFLALVLIGIRSQRVFVKI